jgi:transposase
MVGALTLEGMSAMMTVEGGTNEAVFLTFVLEVLGPTLRQGDIVVLDNLAAHKTAGVIAAIKSFGATPWFLPPWSPDLNPIEWAWSKIKNFLKISEARTLDSLNTAIAWAMEMVTSEDAKNWCSHCGYLYQPT